MTALPKPAYVMSEPHLSGWRVVLGYETLADAQAAQSAVSAPEAREEALGNLLAVIHGDGGHRALEVGTKQAALEAEKIVANLLSSALEAREGVAPVRGEARVINGKRCRFIERELEGDKWEVIGPAHPAAPSGDKLRIAVEALETSRENLIGWFEAIDAEIRVEHEMHVSLKDDLAVIDQALATLEAEGKS